MYWCPSSSLFTPQTSILTQFTDTCKSCLTTSPLLDASQGQYAEIQRTNRELSTRCNYIALKVSMSKTNKQAVACKRNRISPCFGDYAERGSGENLMFT